MGIDLENLRRRLMEAAVNGVPPGQVFKELGLTPENVTAVKELLSETGIDLEALLQNAPTNMPEFINNFTQKLAPEVKRQLVQMVQGMAKDLNNGRPLPKDVEDFLKGWGEG